MVDGRRLCDVERIERAVGHRVRTTRVIIVLVAISLAMTACSDTSTGLSDATCVELTDVMLRWAQEDLRAIESWPREDQAALLADTATLEARAELVYLHTIFSRLGDETCGAQELRTMWCRRIRDLSAASHVGRVVRTWMIESQCGAA